MKARKVTDEEGALISEYLAYNAETGIMTWRKSPGGVMAGTVVGSPVKSGHLKVQLKGRKHSVHRIAWFIQTGRWPGNEIDHINGDPTDNRFANLRDVTQHINQQNQKRSHARNATGLLGVRLHAYGKYEAAIRVGGKMKYLGLHRTPEAAHNAYLAAKRQLHEGCTI